MARQKKAVKSDMKLQNPDFWDQDPIEVTPAKKNRRAIVSIAFSRDEFLRVANTAKVLNKRTSEFIRDAALAEVEGNRSYATILRWGGFHVEGTVLVPSEEFPESPTTTLVQAV